MIFAMIAMFALTAQGTPSLPVNHNPPTLHLKQSVRIGSEDRADYTFTWVGGIAVSSDGTMYVSQPLQQTVLAYSSDGKFIRRIGRKGGGPGEFRGVDRISWSVRGLSVVDLNLNRLTQFDSRGKVLQTWPSVPHAWGEHYMPGPPLVIFDNGMMAAKPNGWSAALSPTLTMPLASLGPSEKFLAKISDLTIGDKFKPAVSENGAKSNIHMPNGTFTLFEFSTAENAVITIDRAIGPETSTFVVHKTSIDGKVIYRRTFSQPTVTVSSDDVTKEINRMAVELSKYAPQILNETQARGMYLMAWGDIKYQTPVDEIVAGRDGSMWLRRGAFAQTNAEWLAYDAAGNLTGRVVLPIATRVLAVSRTTIWVTENDEDDVPYVVRYAIVGR